MSYFHRNAALFAFVCAVIVLSGGFSIGARTLTTFNDGQDEVTVNASVQCNQTLAMALPKGAKIASASFTISTRSYAPSSAQVLLGEHDGMPLYAFGGTGWGSFGLQNEFRGGEHSIELPEGNSTREVLVPSNASITGAEIELSGMNMKGGVVLTCVEDVTCMAYDEFADVIWYGSYGGLVRFDPATGSSVAYTMSDGLCCPWVTCIAFDRDVVYAGTKYGGVSLFMKASSRFASTWNVASGTLPEDEISALLVDGSTVYVGTASEGVARYSKASSSFLPSWNTDNELANNNILSFASDTSMVYLGSEDGVFRFDKSAGAFVSPLTMDSGLCSNYVSAMCAASYGGDEFLFIGTDDGMSKFSSNAGKIISNWNRTTGLFSGEIENIIFDGSALYAVAIRESYDPINDWYLPRNVMAIDKDNGSIISSYDESSGLGRYASALALREGSLLVGTMRDGIFNLDPRTGAVAKASTVGNSMPHLTIKTMASDANNLYFGSSHGEVVVFSKSENRFVGWWDVSQGISFNEVTCILRVDSSNSSIFVGTRYAGLLMLDLSGRIVSKWNASTPAFGENLVSCVAYDDDSDTIFVGTEGGLVRLSASNGTVLGKWDSTNGLGEDVVRSVSLDGTTLLIGTSTRGLDRYNLSTENFETPLNLDSGLSEDSIISAFGDGRTIYIATPNNVNIYDRASGIFLPPVNMSTGLPAQQVVGCALYGEFLFILSRLAGDTVTYLSKYHVPTGQHVASWNWKQIGDRESDMLYIEGNVLYILTQTCIARLDIYSNAFRDSSEYWNLVEPSNAKLDVGGDGFFEWTKEGKFNSTVMVDIKSAFEGALARARTCENAVVDAYGNYLVPIKVNFYADSGTLVVRRLAIVYALSVSTCDFASLLDDYLREHYYEVNHAGNIEVPIVVALGSAGECSIGNLSVAYSIPMKVGRSWFEDNAGILIIACAIVGTCAGLYLISKDARKLAGGRKAGLMKGTKSTKKGKHVKYTRKMKPHIGVSHARIARDDSHHKHKGKFKNRR